jgi:type II secretory pathway pseudopilin PulG
MHKTAYSVVELLVCLALVLLAGAVATPGLLAARDSVRADGATDYLMGVLHGARIEALKRRAHVAVRFEVDGADIVMATYADGNGNGVRAADITSGLDPLLRPRERLSQHFANVAFGFADGVPDVDGVAVGADPDPIRVGKSRMLSFSPVGTSSTGTVYLRARGARQSAVRVLGATGRIRSLSYEHGAGQWAAR